MQTLNADGAAVTFMRVDQTVLATATGGMIHSGSLTIDAEAGNAGSSQVALHGGGQRGWPLCRIGAAMANNVESAGIGSTVDLSYAGSIHSAATTVSVTANDTSSVRAEAYGFGGIGVRRDGLRHDVEPRRYWATTRAPASAGRC